MMKVIATTHRARAAGEPFGSAVARASDSDHYVESHHTSLKASGSGAPAVSMLSSPDMAERLYIPRPLRFAFPAVSGPTGLVSSGTDPAPGQDRPRCWVQEPIPIDQRGQWERGIGCDHAFWQGLGRCLLPPATPGWIFGLIGRRTKGTSILWYGPRRF
eukprot:6191670-Pleurochrysis_carterae.AAC.2